MNILSANEASLSLFERNSVSKLFSLEKKETSTCNGQKYNPYMSYFDRLAQNQHRLSECATIFIDCRFITATSATAKRSFSAAIWILTCLRKRMSPILFESLLFLKLNRSLSNLQIFSLSIKMKLNERYVSLDDEVSINEINLGSTSIIHDFYININRQI